MSKIYDVIISGCGPTGSILGFLLSKENIETLIIEKENFPRLKICAGGIQHRTLSLIPFGINNVIEKVIYGIYFSLKNKKIFFKKNDNPILYTVNRAEFDAMLAKNAEKQGCVINFGEEVVDYKTFSSFISINTTKNKYKAKILVGADGVRGAVHKKLLGEKKVKKILGYETELDLSFNNKPLVVDKSGNIFDFTSSIRLDFNGVKKGYCWVFPKNNFLSCGIGAPYKDAKKMREYFKTFLKDFYLNENLKDDFMKIYAQGIPIRDDKTPICNYRVLAVGDAACLGDGFTGEGLYNGFRSSNIAYECIISALKKSNFYFNDYKEKIDREIYRDIKISLLLTKIFYSSILFIYKLLQKNDNYFYACCKVLRGEKSYIDVVNKLKFLKF